MRIFLGSARIPRVTASPARAFGVTPKQTFPDIHLIRGSRCPAKDSGTARTRNLPRLVVLTVIRDRLISTDSAHSSDTAC